MPAISTAHHEPLPLRLDRQGVPPTTSPEQDAPPFVKNTDDYHVHQLQETLAKRTCALESLKTKYSQLEFCQREAIHFLTKPLLQADQWATDHTAPINPIQIQLIECVRFAVQYLRASHQNVIASVPVSPIQHADTAGPLGSALVMATGDYKVTMNPKPLLLASSKEMLSPSQTMQRHSPLGRNQGHARSRSLSSAILKASTSSRLFAAEGQEYDLGSNHPITSPLGAVMQQTCGECRAHMIQIDAHKDEAAKQQHEINKLTEMLASERELKSRMAIAKQVLEQEVEELTSQLFSEANRLVEQESRKRDALESVNRNLNQQLLNIRVTGQKRTAHKYKSTGSLLGDALPPLVADLEETAAVYVDGLELGVFQEFVQRLNNLVGKEESCPLVPWHVLECDVLMRRCMTEDIEPCLNPMTTSVGSKQLKRGKLIEALATGTASVTLVPHKVKPAKCVLCQHTRVCDYVLQLMHPATFIKTGLGKLTTAGDDVYPIDRFCRDRVMSVRDFIMYVRLLPTTTNKLNHHQQQAKKSAIVHQPPILDLFSVFLAHRRRLANARIGSPGLFRETDVSGVECTSIDYENVQITC